MTQYQPRISHNKELGEYYAFIVRVDHDGTENVARGYQGRYFKTHAAAVRSTNKFISTLAGV